MTSNLRLVLFLLVFLADFAAQGRKNFYTVFLLYYIVFTIFQNKQTMCFFFSKSQRRLHSLNILKFS